MINLCSGLQAESDVFLFFLLDGYNEISSEIAKNQLLLEIISNGKSRYAILEEHTPDVLSDKYSRVLKDAVIAMNIGQNIVVVKTIPGMAMAAAAALDAMKWPEILGCIAGDDINILQPVLNQD